MEGHCNYRVKVRKGEKKRGDKRKRKEKEGEKIREIKTKRTDRYALVIVSLCYFKV